MLNVISVDVEEYFHAENLRPVAGPRHWRRLPSRVVDSTKRVLALFARHDVRATFFVLGYCARRHPELVREIVNAGHELASHGYGHRLAYNQSPKQFSRDIRIAKNILEDISGKQVLGYRAPNFSITDQNDWAFDCLVEAGYRYDSSRYPVWHPRYANTGQSVLPEVLERKDGKLLSFPLAVATPSLLGKTLRLPVAGGAYWRLLPRWYNVAGLKHINSSGRWFVSYFHPWEIDSGQPEFPELPWKTRFRHSGFSGSFENTIASYLQKFRFAPLNEVAIESMGEVAKEILQAS